MAGQLDSFIDRYNWQARVWPAFICLMPVVLALVAWFPEAEKTLGPIIGIIAVPGPFLLAQLSRDAGKRLQDTLLAEWGQMPSVRFLRHSDTKVDRETKDRYHRRLESLLAGTHLPTRDEEVADPARADEIYRSCCNFLLSRTRDKSTYDLLFQENVNYGFRRNVVGLRGLVIATSVIGVAVSSARIIYEFRVNHAITILSITATAGCLILGACSIWLFNRQWVKSAADGYGLRLLEAVETISADKPGRSL